MRIILCICFLLIVIHPSLYASTQEKTFRWQANPEHKLYAPLSQEFKSGQYQSSTGKLRLPGLYQGKPFLIAVRDPDCPISKRYSAELKRLEDSGLEIIFLLTGSLATHQVADQDKISNQFSGLYILDTNRELSSWLGVKTSTEVYLFNDASVLQYRGAINDQFGIGVNKSAATQHFLQDALDAIKEGIQVATPLTNAPGCIQNSSTINKPINVTASWNDGINDLFNRKCETCHQPGQAGPFPLQSYQQVKDRKEMIRFVLDKNIMPPWSVSEGTDNLVGDRYLSAEDRQTLIDWIDAGTPLGKTQSSLIKKAKETGEWKYGEPDFILTSPEKIYIPENGEVAYRYVSIPTNFGEDKWVSSMEVATDAPQNTHHIILFALPPEELKDKLLPGVYPRTGLSRKELHMLALRGFFNGYVPGLPGIKYQNNTAKLLPKDWRIVLQIHHQTTGKKMVDRPRVGLQFLNGYPEKIVNTRAATDIDLNIPAGVKRHLETGEYNFTKDGEIIGFYPHMHLRGTAFKYELIHPDNKKEVLLDVPRYDPNWQQYYQLKNPIKIKAGSTLIAHGWFDNSKENLNNPDSNVNVKFGLRTRDEMLIGYFDWVEYPVKLSKSN